MSVFTCPCCGARLEVAAAGGRQSRPNGHAGGHTPAQPWTIERARAFVMPLGKYKGRTIGQIGLADPAYLEWVAETMDRNVGMAAKTYLEHEQAPATVATGSYEFDEHGNGDLP